MLFPALMRCGGVVAAARALFAAVRMPPRSGSASLRC